MPMYMYGRYLYLLWKRTHDELMMTVAVALRNFQTGLPFAGELNDVLFPSPTSARPAWPGTQQQLHQGQTTGGGGESSVLPAGGHTARGSRRGPYVGHTPHLWASIPSSVG